LTRRLLCVRIYPASKKLDKRWVLLAANLYVSELLDRYGILLSEKQLRILDGYYNNDLSLSEIAENEGITRQGVSDFVKRGEAQLLEFENGIGQLELIKNLKRTAAAVKNGEMPQNELLDLIDKL